MKKLLLIFLLYASPLFAQGYAKVSIIGTGAHTDPYRPNVPAGITYQANIPTDPKTGKPNVFFAVIQVPASVDLKQFVAPTVNTGIIDKATADKLIKARDPTVDTNIPVPPNAVTQGFFRLFHWLLPSSAEAVTASDNFARGDGTLITGNWSQIPTGYYGELSISSNVVVSTSANDYSEIGIWTASAFSDDQVSEIFIGAWNPGGNNQMGPTVRGASGLANSYLCRMSVDPPMANIDKLVANSLTTIASTSFSAAAGDQIKCEANGTAITMYKNNGSVLPWSDSALTSGYPGFQINWSAADAQGDQTVSSWSGGDLGSGAVAIRHRPIIQ